MLENTPLYFYALGMRQEWNDNKIPAYIYQHQESNIHEVRLWLQIKDSKLRQMLPIFITINKSSFQFNTSLFILIFSTIFMSNRI